MSITINAEKAAEIDAANVPVKKIETVAAAFGLGVAEGDITGIEAAAGFAAGLYLDVGLYMLFFERVQSDTDYYPKAYDDTTTVRVTEKALDYVLVEAKDGNGNPADPTTFNVEISRII